MRFAKLGGAVPAQCSFARASPVSLSRKPLSPVPEATTTLRYVQSLLKVAIHGGGGGGGGAPPGLT